MKIKDMIREDRPSYRISAYGAGALSNAELLQVVTGVADYDTAHSLLASDGVKGLARMTTEELTAVPGVGPQTAARIKAAIELGRRVATATRTDTPRITSPADAAALLMSEMQAYDQEHLIVIMLASRNEVIGVETVYKGNVNTVVTRVGELFKPAIRRNAVAVIVVHNHPSGDPSPSPADVTVTRKIVEAGKLLNIEVLDHLVIGDNRFVSLKERGLGFDW